MTTLAGGEDLSSYEVEEEAMLSSDFGTTEVRMIETARLPLLLLLLKQCLMLFVFLSEEEDGNGEDVLDRLFPQEGEVEPTEEL